MVNRQTRSPGDLARYSGDPLISTDLPSYAVDTGQASRALADVAGNLSDTLGKLADRAAAREGQLAGLTEGQQAGAAYLQTQQVTAQAGGAAGVGPWEEQAKALIRKEEGFITKPKFDVNKYRVGYSSDTTVTPDGKVLPVTAGTIVDQGAAERDLDYRIAQREGLAVRKQLGPAFDALPDPAKAAVTSIGYNYGSLPDPVVAAAKSGNLQQLASAVAALPTNSGRRKREAALILGSATTSPAPDGPVPDQVEGGNVDLARRPQVKNDDGSVSTVRSMSFGEDGVEILVPTVSPDGKILSNDEAIDLYHKTGQHLGKFKTADAADAYAERLHDAQSKFYGLDGGETDKAANTYQAPVVPTAPLALRRDNTIRGDAMDDAAISAYSWRMQAGLSTDLYNAAEQFQDDPAGFSQASKQVHDQYAQAIPQDPKMQEAFSKAFVERTESYRQNIAARHGTQLRNEQTASYAAGLSSQQVDLERQAQILGANPDGDKIIGNQVRTIQNSIDGAIAAGTITPAQGETAKQNVAETAARGRIQGVYDALPTNEQKQHYSLDILDDWKTGKGPLSTLPFSTVKAMSDTLRRDALERINQDRAQNKVEAARLGGLVDDDVTSLQATGKGLDPTQSGLTADHVQAVLGDEGLARWQAAREKAGRIYDATNGMDTQSTDDLTQRLATIEPKPGTPGYAENLEIYEAAQKQASETIKERSRDPAAAVDKSFTYVSQAAAAADPQNPSSMQALVTARMHAQQALGISDFDKAPLTNSEALALSKSVTSQTDPGLASKAMMDLVTHVDQTYGPVADKVLSQVLHAQGVDKAMADLGAGYFRRLSRGQQPTVADKRQGQVLNETSAADNPGARQPFTYGLVGRGKNLTERVPNPARDAATWSNFVQMPNYLQMQRLQQNPQLAPQFDEKFGPGSAARVLGPPVAAPAPRR